MKKSTAQKTSESELAELACDVSFVGDASDEAEQTVIGWIAKSGVDLRLYGRGWDQHPEFARFARGHADDPSRLSRIHKASRINLQLTPFASSGRLLLDGLAAGGFFLLRGDSADLIEMLNQKIWTCIQSAGVKNPRRMMDFQAQSPVFRWLIGGLEALGQTAPLANPESFYSALQEGAISNFTRSPATLWPRFNQVCFWNESQLTERIAYFLAHPEERRAIAESMRRQAASPEPAADRPIRTAA